VTCLGHRILLHIAISQAAIGAMNNKAICKRFIERS